MRFNSYLWYYSHNWSYLYDADGFFQFLVLIRILYDISIPNQSRDSFIFLTSEYFTLMEKMCESQFKLVE